MARTAITATNAIATTEAVEFSGMINVRADGLTGSQYVEIYEETNTDESYAAKTRVVGIGTMSDEGKIRLTASIPSINIELYGYHKFLLSEDDSIEVGYVAG